MMSFFVYIRNSQPFSLQTLTDPPDLTGFFSNGFREPGLLSSAEWLKEHLKLVGLQCLIRKHCAKISKVLLTTGKGTKLVEGKGELLVLLRHSCHFPERR